MSRGYTRTLADDPLGGTVHRSVLPNGLRVLTEAVAAMRSVSVGIWVGAGSRDETGPLGGVSHFLEHLLFKGTNRRGALEISAEIEAVGGDTNAFTAKEYTCFHARVLDQDLPLAIDVVCDLVTDSVLTPDDVELERGVILEEIAMHEDEPGDEVHDMFADLLFGAHPLGRPVLGTTQSITGLTREQIHGFYRERYVAPSMVVSAAGNLDHTAMVRLVQESFARSAHNGGAAGPAPRRDQDSDASVPSPRRGKLVVKERDTEQAHVVLGGPGLARLDEARFAFGVLNNVLGGGMSSRLFQEIRERRGLAYSVYSFSSTYADTGVFGVYAGCAPGKADEVLELIRAELAAVADRGLTDDEVKRGKGMYKGSLVLGLEDTGSRMSRLGKGELLYDRLLSVDEILDRVDAVTPDDVREVAARVLRGAPSLAVVGPFGGHDFAPAVAG